MRLNLWSCHALNLWSSCFCVPLGLPKAAMVSQTRLLAALAVLASNGVTARDTIYLNLPLYHTAGFLIGFIGTIETGNPS